MSVAVANASRLKPEIRLAQAVSLFEADLSSKEKETLRAQKSRLQSSAPDQDDVMRLTAEIDKTSGIVAGRRCFGPRLTNFLHAVQQFAALGDVVVGGSQNLIACGVWMLIRMSLLSIATYSSYLDKFSSLFMDIGRSAPHYQLMALLYPQSKRLQAGLAEYFAVAVSLCHQIWKFARKSTFHKVLSTLSDADLRTYESNLGTWANAIKEEVTILMAKNAHEDGHNIAEIKTVVTKGFRFASYQKNLQTRLRILDLCSTYDFQTTWKQTRKAGYCSLYTQSTEYQDWRNQAGSSTLVYMGKLGSGKSVLLANIVEDLVTCVQQKHVPVAYFFCQHDVPESLEARTIIGSLARQLLLSIPDLVISREIPDGITSQLDVEDICSLLHRVLSESKAAYIVLDGLDECDSTVEELLVQQLQKLQGTIPLHLCISFRLDPAKNQFLDLTELASARTLLMPDDNPEIEAYIDGQLENLVSSEKLKLGDPVLILDIQRKLMDGSQGMFLWVALQLQCLCTMKTDDSIRQALDDLPKNLPETFTRILERSESQDRAYQKRILEFVAAVFRPLTTEELREALSVIPGDTDWRPSSLINDFVSTLACCGGLVVVDEEEMTVRLVHHSFKQFLVSEFQDLEGESFTMDLAHKNVADTIVTYLNYGVFGTQLSTTIAPRMKIGSAPSQIVRGAIGSSTVQEIALKLLNSRKRPDFDIGKAIMDAGGQYDKISPRRFYFHDYAKSFCMQHILCTLKQQLTSTKLLAQLLDRDVINANATMKNNETLLWRAAASGYEAVVKLLLRTGKADINAKDENGRTPLWQAAENGNEGVVRLLLETGKAEINTKDNVSQTPLLLAVANGHKAVVRLLLETDEVDIDAKDNHSQMPLLLAAENGYEDIVKLLLETGKVNVNARDKLDWTPLSRAAANGHEAVVRLLLETDKVDINAKDRIGRMPLWRAAENGHEAVIRLLLETGRADVNAKDENGRTPLWRAAENEHEAVVRLLLETGKADVEAKDGIHERTPLLQAATMGHEAIVRLLLEIGEADVNVKDRSNQTPLSRATKNGHKAVVRLLRSTSG